MLTKNTIFVYNPDSNCYHQGVLPQSNNILVALPPDVYNVQVIRSPMGQSIRYVPRGLFELPAIIYGDVDTRVERVVKSYHNSYRNLGVILAGKSGAGKSITAKTISNRMVKEGKPVLVFDQRNIDVLYDVVESFSEYNQDIVIFLDEYEKIFTEASDTSSDEDQNNERSKNSQNHLLPLLDGVMNTHNLFLMTLNDVDKVNDYFFNRPSRIRYYWVYDNLPLSIINEFIDNNIVDETRRLEAKIVIMQAQLRTYDILNEFVIECNQFPELTPSEIAEGFNVTLSDDELSDRYNLFISYKSSDENDKDDFCKYLSPYFDGGKITFNSIGKLDDIIKSTMKISLKYTSDYFLGDYNTMSVTLSRVSDIRFGSDYIEADYVIVPGSHNNSVNGVCREMTHTYNRKINDGFVKLEKGENQNDVLEKYHEDMRNNIDGVMNSGMIITLRLTETKSENVFKADKPNAFTPNGIKPTPSIDTVNVGYTSHHYFED